MFALVIAVAMGIFGGQFVSKKLIGNNAIAKTKEVVEKTSSGDPVRDFLDNF